jgi:hypothetical protein
MNHAGYETTILLAFLEAHGEKRHDGQLAAINEIRAPESTREMLIRWARWDHIALDKVDTLLMRHGLMLFELEDWARREFGRDGFFDPNTEPVELVA